jgi:hypothetical protein
MLGLYPPNTMGLPDNIQYTVRLTIAYIRTLFSQCPANRIALPNEYCMLHKVDECLIEFLYEAVSSPDIIVYGISAVRMADNDLLLIGHVIYTY